MLNKVTALPGELGDAGSMLADSGYFSAANVAACVAAEIEPVTAPCLREGKDETSAPRHAFGRALCGPTAATEGQAASANPGGGGGGVPPTPAPLKSASAANATATLATGPAQSFDVPCR